MDIIYNYSATSIKQIPALFKKVEWKKNTKNLDLGGGMFHLTTVYLRKKGVKNFVFDPYCRTRYENWSTAKQKPFDSCTISNVLNVIPNVRNRLFVLLTAKELVKQGGNIFISVYEGNKMNRFRVSKKNTWQANRRIEKYLSEVKTIFPESELKSIRGFKYIQIKNV